MPVNRLEYVEQTLNSWAQSVLTTANADTAAALSPATTMYAGTALTAANFPRGKERSRHTDWPVISAFASEIVPFDRTCNLWTVGASVRVWMPVKAYGGDFEELIRAMQRWEQLIGENMNTTNGLHLATTDGSIVSCFQQSGTVIPGYGEQRGGELVPISAAVVVECEIVLNANAIT